MKLGILTDVHEDLLSLVKAIDVLDQRGCDELICLGDISGFNVLNYRHLHVRNAHECLEVLKKNCSDIILGNHDLHHIKKLPTYSNGFAYPENWYELDFDEKRKLGEGKVFLYDDFELPPLLQQDDIQYLSQLPEYIVKTYDGINILFSHFAYPDFTGSRSFYPKLHQEAIPHLHFIERNECLIGITGHFHYPGFASCNEEVWEKHSFGAYTIENRLQWIYGPCIARFYKKNGDPVANGVMILNTSNLEIEVIPLGHGAQL